MKWRDHDLGVCSWSLRPAGMRELVAGMRELEINHVHLAMGPLLELPAEERREEIAIYRDSGLIGTAAQIGFSGEDYSTISSIERTAGLVPSSSWPARCEWARQAAGLAAEMGIAGLSLHLGFVPQSNDPAYEPVLKRVCEIAEPALAVGVSLLLETGQESSSELLQFLNDVRCQSVEANLDPANFLLYGVGDPLVAVATLGRHIRHVHLKDAVLSDQPGSKWGKEVRLGEGQVPVPELLESLGNVDYTGPLVIENEFDENFDGIRAAIRYLNSIE